MTAAGLLDLINYNRIEPKGVKVRWVVLALVGFAAAGQAQAQDRWPQKPCDDVKRTEAELVKLHAINFASIDATEAANALGTSRLYLLLLLRDYCGVNVQAKLAIDQAASRALVRRSADEVARSEAKAAKKRSSPSLNCVTMGLGQGSSVTNCN